MQRLTVLSAQIVGLIFIFILINFMVGMAMKARITMSEIPLLKEPVRQLFTDMTDAELETLHHETWGARRWGYRPWVGFAETPRSGTFVNVSPRGFRRTVGSSNDLLADHVRPRVFFFGGSTTFGYNVADKDTIASHLQARMGVTADVFNFGRGYYFSKQENVLLEDLVDRGFQPSRAIFLDGINEVCDVTVYVEETKELFQLAQFGQTGGNSLAFFAQALLSAPAVYALDRLAMRLTNARSSRTVSAFPLVCDGGESLSRRFEQRLRFRIAFCRLHAIDCHTFLQPFAGVHGIHTDHDLLKDAKRRKLAKTFEELKQISPGLLFDISCVLAGDDDQSYVDDVHYSPAANNKIAAAIYEVISRKERLTCDSPV